MQCKVRTNSGILIGVLWCVVMPSINIHAIKIVSKDTPAIELDNKSKSFKIILVRNKIAAPGIKRA